MNVGDSLWAVTSNVRTQNEHTVLAAWIVVIQTLHWRLWRLGLGELVCILHAEERTSVLSNT